MAKRMLVRFSKLLEKLVGEPDYTERCKLSDYSRTPF